MATITITFKNNGIVILGSPNTYRGIGKIERIETAVEKRINGNAIVSLTIPRMSDTRFNNVVKRVLTKNLTEQGIEPISIEYNES